MVVKQKTVWLITLLSTSASLMAGQSPVLNGDLPGGSGDWESHKHNLTVECEITAGDYKGIHRSDDPDPRLPEGYNCTSNGAWCANRYTIPKNGCINMKARWLWEGGGTPWFDRDETTGMGDYEVIEAQLNIQCIFGIQVFESGQVLPAGYTCEKMWGAWCENSKTQPLNSCKHAPVKIRYFW